MEPLKPKYLKLYSIIITILLFVSISGNIALLYNLTASPVFTGFIVAILTPLVKVAVAEYKKTAAIQKLLADYKEKRSARKNNKTE